MRRTRAFRVGASAALPLCAALILSTATARAAPKPDAAPPPPPCDTRVRLANQSDRPIFELYLRRSAGPGDAGAGWGAELLGARVLARDGTLVLTPKEPGRYDLLLLTAEDRAHMVWRQDFCAISTVTLDANGAVEIR